MGSAVEIALLGEVSARLGGRPVELGPARQRCVLTALAVDVNKAVSVTQLTERVWGADPPLRSRATLHSYLSRLRQAFAETDAVTLASRSGGYVLIADESAVDLLRFRKLRHEARGRTDDQAARILTEATALWRGEPLTGIGGEWAGRTRDRLAQERDAAELDLADARLRLGQGPELVAALSTLTSTRPLDERVAAQYMRALAQAGRISEALEQFRVVRARLVEELGTEPAVELRRLHEKLLLSDQETAPAPVEVPRQLPSAPAQFVGRHQDLTQLDHVLRTVGVATIAGAGGMGKTWLALHWAHRNLHRFPDGQLFVDLRGFSPDETPMEPDVAIRGFLHALGLDANRVPPDPHARATLFRSLTADRRMLVVVDNAADASQVVPILPGGDTCRLLVTSRNRLLGLVTAHGALPVGLEVLADRDASALLASRIGATRLNAEPLAVARLIDLCGGLPLALSIVSARVLTEPDLSLAAIARQLEELGLGALDTDPSVSVPVVLSWSYRALTEPQKVMFALLGTAPGADVGLPAAASLAGVSTEDARTTLRALAQASLVSIGSGFRARMHDLVRAYAAGCATDHDAALRRLVDHHVHVAHANDRLIDPHRPLIDLPDAAEGALVTPAGDKAGALAWFDAERAALQAVQQAAAWRGWNDRVVLLARVSHAYHQLRGHLDDELTVWQVALDAAADLAGQVVAHRIMGSSLGQVQRFDEAQHHLDEALVLAERADDPLQLGDTHGTLAWLWASRSEFHRALAHATASLPHYRQAGNQMLLAMAHNNIGYCAAEIGDLGHAREHVTTALNIFVELGDRYGQANAFDTLGRIEHQSGNHAESIKLYRDTLTIYREEEDAYHRASTLTDLGHPHLALGDQDAAAAVWRDALEMFERQGRHEEADRVRKQLTGLHED